MVTPFFFGPPERTLAGVLHQAGDARLPAIVVVPSLLQEGIVSHRCLWWLAERLASDEGAVLRFDAYGTGDSAGDSTQITLEGLCEDARASLEWMQGYGSSGLIRQLAVHSASIPVLQSASLAESPVDLVLWDPVMSGSALVSGWKAQHIKQLTESGRYPFQPAVPEGCDLLGFELAPELLAALASFDAMNCVLPAGSRLRIATWEVDAALDQFVQEQQQSGIDAEIWELESPDRPDWEDASKFEDQVFPRRSASRIADLLKEQLPWV